MGKSRIWIGLALVFFLLAGCRMENIDELFQLPQQAEEHLQLQQEIEAILQEGAEYSAPILGSNRQSVQYVDIDGDGVSEVLVFFRDDTADRPLAIYIFQEVGDTYQVVETIRADGTAIHSIDYVDLNGNGVLELIVGWSLSDMLTLSVYDLWGFVATPVISENFTDYLTFDLTGDGLEELVVLDHEGPETNAGLVIYSYDGAEEAQSYTVALSRGIESVVTIVQGQIQSGVPGLVVESSLENEYISDVIIWRDGGPVNITLDGVQSLSTLRSLAVYTADVDGDGILETPMPVALHEYAEGIGPYYALQWYNYTRTGGTKLALTTYHNFTDSWYLVIDNDWPETMAVRRNDEVAGERAVIFSMVDGDDTTDFLIIYTLTGDNKEDRAGLAGRFILEETETAIYAARILENLGSPALTEANMTLSFHRIVARWEN